MELFQEILPTVHPRRQQHQQIRLIRSLTFSSIKSSVVVSSPFFSFFSPFRCSRRQELNCRALVELESNRKIPPFSNFPTFRKSRKQKGASDAIFIFTKQDWNPCVNKTLVAILQLLTVHVCSKTVGWMSTYVSIGKYSTFSSNFFIGLLAWCCNSCSQTYKWFTQGVTMPSKWQ